MSAAEILSENEYLAEKRSFERKYEILRTISQPRTSSANIPAARKAFPPINFHIAQKTACDGDASYFFDARFKKLGRQ